jgi:hypothetical protein
VTAAILTIIPLARKSLAVGVSPTDVTGYGNSGAAANITTGLVVATPGGGVAPFTYAWTQTSTSPYTWTISSAATASTSFTCVALGAGNTAEATFQVLVTDAVGTTAAASVNAFANNGQPYDDRDFRNRRSDISGIA